MFGLSLIFSKAGKRIWLKTAGILSFIIDFTVISAVFAIWILQYKQIADEVEKIGQWIPIVAILAILFLILNYVSELREFKTEKVKIIQPTLWKAILSIAGILVLVFALFLGQKLGLETLEVVQEPDEAKRLTKHFEARTYSNTDGDAMPYRLLIPLNYDPQKKYP
ncbi:unnamed protein product, partial [marine sediment metagenome]